MDSTLEFAISLAIQTGKLLQEYFNHAGVHALVKPDKTVVTEADLAADALVTGEIKNHFPHDGIISEESSHFLSNPQSPTWVIDPLDGTTNFSLGLPIWGVSIARLMDGIPGLGVVFFPHINELYFARRGSGSFLNHNPITVQAPDHSQAMSFFACCSRTFRNYKVNVPYKPRVMGSSTYSFSMLARGSALMGFDAAPKIWDLSAVWLLIEESGGQIQSFEDARLFPLQMGVDYGKTSYPVLAASTSSLMDQGRAWITKK
jgi:myo-inositol-1(or 4)-monophosphatase